MERRKRYKEFRIRLREIEEKRLKKISEIKDIPINLLIVQALELHKPIDVTRLEEERVVKDGQ